MARQSLLFECLSGVMPGQVWIPVFPVLAFVLVITPPAYTEQVTVAVAANFVKPLEATRSFYERSTKHTLVISSGSTGQLYAQIKNGAPYDVFLAADEKRTLLLEEQGDGVAGTRFTYAVGRLVLWGPKPGSINSKGLAILAKNDFRSLAIANPELAPYGLAAKQTLEQLQLWNNLQNKIVMGENIGQTFSMVYTGNAELGFVALSQVLNRSNDITGNRWVVPAEMHDPIVQQAILLDHGNDNPAAHEFIGYLRSEEARKIISEFGYGLE